MKLTDKAARVDGVEVVEIRFDTLDDLKKNMCKSPDLFTPWFVELADRLALFTGRVGTYQ